jgi:hypothetical protein
VSLRFQTRSSQAADSKPLTAPARERGVNIGMGGKVHCDTFCGAAQTAEK